MGVLLTLAPPRRGEVDLDRAEAAAVAAFVRAGMLDAEEAEGLVAVLDDAAMAV